MFTFELPRDVRFTQIALINKGWIFSMERVDRGSCIYHEKRIILPAWLQNRKEDYCIWYICHEMAHALAGYQAKHGDAFMQTLRTICPSYALHHEAGYKPRNALRNGIVKIAEDF